MLSQKVLKKKIVGIKKDARSLRDRVHTVIIHTACHAFAHRDVDLFTQLFRSVSGLNRTEMVKFIQENGLAKFQDDGSFKLNSGKHKAAREEYATVEAFMAMLEKLPKWYMGEADAAAILKALDVNKSLKSLADKLETPKTVTDADGNEVTQQIVVDFAQFHKDMQRINDAVELRFAEAV